MSTSLAPREPLRRGRRWAASVALVCLLAAACSTSTNHAKSPSASGSTSTAASSSPSASGPASTSAPPSGSASPSAQASAVPADFRPASVTFVSSTTGFVIGTASCASGTCTLVVRTADAGRTWTTVGAVPAALTGTDTAVTKVRYADANDGWAFDPQLWATHDGGRTWHQIAEPGQVYDVEASGGSAYALVASCTDQPCASGPSLLRTSAGSDGWAPVGGVQLAPATSGGSIALHAHAVWLATTGQGVAQLFTSPDGTTWHSLGDPCTAAGGASAGPWVLAGVAPVSTSSVFLLCGGGAAAGSQQKRVLYSTDSGAHAVATAADPPFGGDLQGIAAASSQVVTVSARSGASWVYRSADGGRTWNAPLQQGDGGVGYFDVGFTTQTQGVAIYGNPGQVATRLLMTHDAGATWAPVSFS